MKRRLPLLAVSVLLLLAACWSETDSYGLESGREEAAESLAFTARLEGGGMTKTLLGVQAGSVRPVLWAADDSVRINGVRYNVTQLSSDSLTATFVPERAVAGTGGRYQAYYPTEIFNGGVPALPATQLYRAPATTAAGKYPVIAHLPMYAESSSNHLDFRNLCAVLHFSLTGSEKLDSVVVSSRGTALWGPFTVDDSSGAAVIDPSATDAKYKKVVLDCSAGGGVQLTSTTPTDFFVAIPPHDYPSGDLTVLFYGNNKLILPPLEEILPDPADKISCARSSIYSFGYSTDFAEESMSFVVRSTASNRVFSLPLPDIDSTTTTAATVPTDLVISWGDSGSSVTTIPKGTVLTAALRTFTYTDAGEHMITITARASQDYMADPTKPRIPRFSFEYATEESKQMVVSIVSPILRCPTQLASNMFRRCGNLTEVCGKLFSKNPQLTDMSHVFRECASLQTVPADLFEGLAIATNFTRAFSESGLVSLPGGIFSETKLIRNLNSCFYRCRNLLTIPDGLFKGLDRAENFTWVLRESGIGNLPGDTFAGCTAAKNFTAAFCGCTTLLVPIPPGLFADCGSIEDLHEIFMQSGVSGEIPAELFDACRSSVVNTRAAFQSCVNLTKIPDGLFSDFVKDTSFNNVFRGCTSLSSTIPADLFAGCSSVLDFSNAFYSCSSLQSDPNDPNGYFVPEDLFWDSPLVRSFENTFSQCRNLTGKIPEKLFQNKHHCLSFKATFASIGDGIDTDYGKGLHGDPATGMLVPKDLFAEAPGAIDFTNTFRAAFGRRGTGGYIPEALFSRNTAARYFSGVFYGALTATADPDPIRNPNGYILPAGLFSNNKVETIANAFTNLIAAAGPIPPGLFDTCGDCEDMQGVFLGCTGITAIPADLFKNCQKVTNLAMIFRRTAITRVPAGLFDPCINVTAFSGPWRHPNGTSTMWGAFENCDRLEELPAGLFAKNTKATDFTAVFAGCPRLKLRDDLFIDPAAGITASNRFASVTEAVDFTQCFAGVGSSLSDAGTAPALWDPSVYIFNTPPVSARCFQTTWNKYTNGASIPAAWR